MTSKRVKYWASLFLVLTFFLGTLSPALVRSAKADEFTDIDNHWAKVKIVEWVGKGLVNGYTDGTFKPDKSITRAEFMTLVNKAFGFSEKAVIEFSDVAAKDWFYEEIAKAVGAGYISGYQDGTVKPNQEISRQEAAAALCKALKLSPTITEEVNNFADAQTIPEWSKPYIGAVVAEGYMGGYPDGTFKADRSITRAETVVVLDRILGAQILSYDVAGTYGPEEGVETISGDVAINVPGVTLKNMIIEGDLHLNEGIGEGDVTLDNVTVKGTTYIRGGGKDSIHLVNFECEEIIVIKVGGKVRIIASGSTEVGKITLRSGGHIRGKGIAVVTVLKPGEGIILEGDFKKVIVDANAKIEILKDTTIDKLEVDTKAQIALASGATVKDLTLNAPATITGKGTIEAAKINVNGASLETAPKKVKMAKDVTAKIAGKEVKEGETPSKGGGGSGGRPTVISVTGVRLDKTSVTLYVYGEGNTESLTATIEPANATNKAVTWKTANDDVATVDSNGTVMAVAVGETIITVTTKDSGKEATCSVTVYLDKPEEPVEVVDKEVLEELISEAEKLDEEEYTEASWATLSQALEAAKIVMDDDTATQEEVDAACDALEEAIEGLKEKDEVPIPIIFSEDFAAFTGRVELASGNNSDYGIYYKQPTQSDKYTSSAYIEDGRLYISTTQGSSNVDVVCFTDDFEEGDYIVEADLCYVTNPGKRYLGLMYRVQDHLNFQKATVMPNRASLNGQVGGSWYNDVEGVNKFDYTSDITAGKPFRIKLVLKGNTSALYYATYEDYEKGILPDYSYVTTIDNIPDSQQGGTFGFLVSGCTAWIDNIEVRSFKDINEDFSIVEVETELPKGWSKVDGSIGHAVEDGALYLDAKDGLNAVICDLPTVRNYQVEVDVTFLEGEEGWGGITFRSRTLAGWNNALIHLNGTASINTYKNIHPYDKKPTRISTTNGDYITGSTASLEVEKYKTYRLKLIVERNKAKLYVDGKLVTSHFLTQEWGVGGIGLAASGARVQFENLEFTGFEV